MAKRMHGNKCRLHNVSAIHASAVRHELLVLNMLYFSTNKTVACNLYAPVDSFNRRRLTRTPKDRRANLSPYTFLGYCCVSFCGRRIGGLEDRVGCNSEVPRRTHVQCQTYWSWLPFHSIPFHSLYYIIVKCHVFCWIPQTNVLV